MRFLREPGTSPARRSVVVYSRKESGPVAQMTLPPLRPPISPRPAVTCAEIYGNSLFACFKGFRIILLPPFLLPPRVNLLYLPPSELFSACPFPLPPPQIVLSLDGSLSSSSSIRTSIFVQVSTSGYRCNADTNATEHLSP